jgi:divalent metal cation (Fe/Co/Zn/Cd) transporter
MINFLIRLFTGKNNNLPPDKLRARLGALASGTGIFLNLLLFAGKLTVGLIGASVAIMADAFNNISDAGSAIIALIGFRMATKPVDKEHPQGHGRIEYIAGFIVDMLIILVGFELFKTSIGKIGDGSIPTVGNICKLLPSALTMNIRGLPRRSLTKASFFPSGLQHGEASTAIPLVNRRRVR